MNQFAVKRKTTGSYRLGGLPREFWQRAGDVAAAGIVDNIAKQQQANGAQLKQNAPAALLKKAHKGHGRRALVDHLHRFVQGGDGSWKIKRFLANGSGVVIGPATTELATLSRYVQEKGYTGWLGISAATRAALRALFRQALQKVMKGIR